MRNQKSLLRGVVHRSQLSLCLLLVAASSSSLGVAAEEISKPPQVEGDEFYFPSNQLETGSVPTYPQTWAGQDAAPGMITAGSTARTWLTVGAVALTLGISESGKASNSYNKYKKATTPSSAKKHRRDTMASDELAQICYSVAAVSVGLSFFYGTKSFGGGLNNGNDDMATGTQSSQRMREKGGATWVVSVKW